jgi:SH3-like domain-containing protein
MNVRACCLKVLLAGAAALGAMSAAQAADDTPTTEQVKITDPFIELHTGAGRGYPVFHVAARDELITIEMRHTDWYRVRTESGKVGWVHRKQLETTLTMAGGAKSFRDVLVDDYLNRRVQLGASIGRFKAEPMLKLWTAYRLTDTIGLEGTVGQVQGLFSGTPTSPSSPGPTSGCRRTSRWASASSRTTRTSAWWAPSTPTRSCPTPASGCATT